MDILFTFRIKVTTPYRRDNKYAIIDSRGKRIRKELEKVVKTNLAQYRIIGLKVEVK